MKNLLAGGLLIVVLGSTAQAVSFGTTAVIDGVTYTINGANSRVQSIGNTLSFSLPQAFALSGIKTVKIVYSVFSDPATVIDYVKQTSNIATESTSTVDFNTKFTEGTTVENAATQTFAGTSTPTFVHTFTNKLAQWSTVETSLTLTARGGYAKASIYNAEYSPVPEPMTLTGMAAGLLGLLTKRRKKNEKNISH